LNQLAVPCQDAEAWVAGSSEALVAERVAALWQRFLKQPVLLRNQRQLHIPRHRPFHLLLMLLSEFLVYLR
jgi:hypothetical protein